jgi:hypothetical protein
MSPNTSSPTSLSPSAGVSGVPAGLEGLAATINRQLAVDPNQLGDAALAERVLALHRLGGQLAAAELRSLAVADARGAAGAEQGLQAGSTAGWLRATTRMSPRDAKQLVQTARALHRGPLGGTAQALARGEVSLQHAVVLADATHDLPAAHAKQAEPVFLDAARTLDPPTVKRLGVHLRDVLDPEKADERGRARLDKRGLWLSPTHDGTLDVKGTLDPEAGEALQAAIQPLARPMGPDDQRSPAQRRADALGELTDRALQGGGLPQQGGLRPQVTVTVDLDSLLARHGVGGAGAWGGTLSPEAVRRLSCDAIVTRAVVRRYPHHPATGGHDGEATDHAATHDPGQRDHADGGHATTNGSHAGHANHGAAAAGHPGGGGLAARLRQAIVLLPPPLGAPVELLELGRAARVVSPGLRRALAARDGGCAAPGCDRPPAWTDAHHLEHWVDGGATHPDNLVLLCRTHHTAVHEGGWHIQRDPATGRVTMTPPARRGHPPPAASPGTTGWRPGAVVPEIPGGHPCV